MIESMTPQEVARSLREIAQLLQLKGENNFKVRAYDTAAETFEAMPPDPSAPGGLLERVKSGTLGELTSVGKAIDQKVTELVTNGTLGFLDKLRAEFPAGVLDLVRVPGVGPKKALALIEQLDVGSLEELKAACLAGRVRVLKGFGAKSEATILEGVQKLQERTARRPLSQTRPVAEALLARVSAASGVREAAIAGSIRRFAETSGDVDLVCELLPGADANGAMDAVMAAPDIGGLIGRGETKLSVRLSNPSGLQVDLRVLGTGKFATALHHFTGSKAHHVRLRGLARQRGLTLSEYGLVEIATGRVLEVNSEVELYSQLGLPFIPPELREDRGELEAALANALPDLIDEASVQGLIHCHTTWSDGKNTVEEMAREALRLRKKYLSITDHAYAGGGAGITAERLRAQADEIAAVQEKLPGLRILRGVEVDVLEDGALALPDAALEALDLVIASVHQRYQLDETAQTARVVRALAHPLVDIWGHPTGRLLGEREEMAAKMEELLAAAAKHGVAVECNGTPRRLDLSADWLLRARAHGCQIAVSVDAHELGDFGNLRWAIGNARRGWVEKKQVINARPEWAP